MIHFTRTCPKGWLKFSSGSSNYGNEGSVNRCEVCDYEPEKHLGVVKCCLECFSKGRSIHLYEYNVSRPHFLLKFSGTSTTVSCNFSRVEVVQRAHEKLKSNGFGDYDLRMNNCECFAVWCKTGEAKSEQAESWRVRLPGNLRHS